MESHVLSCGHVTFLQPINGMVYCSICDKEVSVKPKSDEQSGVFCLGVLYTQRFGDCG